MDEALLAHLQTFLTDRRRKLFKEILEKRTRHFTVATEDVYQLHNTSAVMRSCEVFGIQDIHVVEESVGKQIDKEIAMGAQKWVNLHRYDSVQDSINSLRDQGYKIIATTPHTNATLLHDFDVSHKSAFFFGKERDGLSDIVMEQADGFLKIPMYGFTESLNLSVSAAITLQSVVTKLKQTEIPWQLSETEKKELELDWTKKTIKSIDEIIERYYEQKKHHCNRG
ncbi:TrmH family RNA methyltransferase [Cochleicola gelatinilyticus]|uniref:tRNA (guanosine(18)-2'-O)-methyltransferase n=1 Tax=Cochleicola gelatinilyticus TaxID=1763537 RepID=A0A167HRB9_9FLAO|nr:RNA methyltransferase [Cochleicola gelatinilyticus]OAB78882.1 rRNA methyltransferase [Cochleicola gelatinilyticus]